MELFIPKHTEIAHVIIPPSKSYAQRAILAAALSKSTSILKNIGKSNDVLALLTVAENLGAEIQVIENDYHITGFSHPIKNHLNVGESGLGMRLTTSISAVLKGGFTLIGEGSLKNRSMDEFSRILPQIGVQHVQDETSGHFKIIGNASPGEINIDGGLSSQYLSGLLMALPLLEGDSIIHVNGLKSKPYIKITLDVMQAFGVHLKRNEFSQFSVPGKQVYARKSPYIIEGDYSGASIWMVYGALQQDILIEGIKKTSMQGDKAMLEALGAANVDYQWGQGKLRVLKSPVQAFDFDATECPDLFPALVVLAAGAVGKTTLKGANRLINKESNRALVLQKEFGSIGLKINLKSDSMEIEGTGHLNNGTIHSNNDHRIAMAGAIAACLTDNGITVLQAESVNKSYPEFWEDFANS